MKRLWAVVILVSGLIGTVPAGAGGPRPPVEISNVMVTWGGYPVSFSGFGAFDPDTPWAAYGDYVQYGAGTLLSGSVFGWNNSFSGTGQVFFPYGAPDSNQYVVLDGESWTADFTSDPQNVKVRFGPDSDAHAVIKKDASFAVTIDRSDAAGDEFYYSGTLATFGYDAASDTVEIYLIDGTVDYGRQTFIGPDDGGTALHLTVKGGVIDSESVPLADALAAIPALLRSLTVQIELVQPVAHSGISAAFDLDGDPGTGLGADAGATVIGVGADLIVSVAADASGHLTGQAQIVQADGDLSDPFPVGVALSESQQAIQLQADLNTIQQQAAQMGVGIRSGGMRWRVAVSDADQPDAPPDFFPDLPAAPVARANFSVSYTTSSGSLEVTFEDKSTPIDPDNPITGWLWDFGDGTTSAETNPAHTYAGGGEYQVTLTLTFADGNTDATTVAVKLEGPPPPEPPPADTCSASTTTAANLRDGPDTIYALVGSLPVDTALYVTGVNAAGDWYQVRTERFPSAWVAGFLITPPQCPSGFTLPVKG